MAQILVPGVAQAVLQGVFGTQPWAVVWHFKFDNSTSNWTQTNIQQLADAISGGWGSYALNIIAPTVVLQQITTTDIGSTTPVVGSNSVSHAGAGGSGALANSSMCTLMRFKINVRYKGGHPRSYLPWGTNTNTLNEFSWNAAYATLSQSAMANLINNVRSTVPASGGNQVSHVVPRYTYTLTNDAVHSKYVRAREGLKSVDVVQSYLLNPTFGVQRRRLRV